MLENQEYYKQFLYNLCKLNNKGAIMITLKDIQKRISEVIKQSGKTQTAIAAELGIRQQNINQYLSGRAMPALDTFANLCKVLDVDPAYILCLDN